MGINEKILDYLSVHGKTNKYKISRGLNIDVAQVIRTFDSLQQEGNITIKEGNAIFVKGKKPIAQKPRKQPTVAAKEEQPIEEESSSEEKVEEKPEKAKEETEEEIKERIEGTVKFFNPNKGFGFIIGNDGKEYYVHGSGLNEGVAIEANDRVSFKAVQGPKGPKAEEVKKISEGTE